MRQIALVKFTFLMSPLIAFSSTDSAANLAAPPALAHHSFVTCHPLAQTQEDVPDERIALFRPSVVHPFSLTPRFHEASALKPRQMPRYFRLNYAEGIGQFADAGFAAGQQIKKAQPGWIGQGFKKPRRSVISESFHCHTYTYKHICVKCSRLENRVAQFFLVAKTTASR